jgi:hypothetical protein
VCVCVCLFESSVRTSVRADGGENVRSCCMNKI